MLYRNYYFTVCARLIVVLLMTSSMTQCLSMVHGSIYFVQKPQAVKKETLISERIAVGICMNACHCMCFITLYTRPLFVIFGPAALDSSFCIIINFLMS